MKRYGLAGTFDITRPVTFTPDPSKIARTLSPTTTPAPTQSWLDKILNVGTKVTNFANQAAGTVRTVQNTFNPQTGQQNQPGGATPFTYTPPGSQQQANTTQGMSTAAKVGIGLGVAALVGTVIYFATGSEKGKK